ncbi:hypothetical protein K3495_g5699 [Podosphaera aphanis]|nr:hypothetical protein K3495_g5699 [Podosphaera aphanis]
MSALLPEILIMICDQLEDQLDFRTLFACALTGRFLSKVALRKLYRIHTDSQVFGRADHIREGFGTPPRPGCRFRTMREVLGRRSYVRKQHFLQRKILWKSIIFSSFDKTAFPYCLYIRSLNLNLEDFKIYANDCHEIFPDTLFAAEMEGLVTYKKCYVPTKCLNYIDIQKTSELIEEFILSYICDAARKSGTIAHLERLTWHSDAGMLTKWVSHFPKLKALAISSGTTSSLDDLAEAISYNCPEFQSLRVIVHNGTNKEKADEIIARFVSRLNQDTLQKFTTVIDSNYNNYSFGNKTLYALNHHIESLTSLKICHMSPETTENLYLLYECKSLISLQFSLAHQQRLELTDNELFEEIIEWICSCRGLRELSVGDSLDGTSIVTRVCRKKRMRLQKIEITAMKFPDSDDFFSVLPYHQPTVEYLRIGGNVAFCCKIAEKNVRRAIPRMTKLKFLDLSTLYDGNTHGGGYDLSTIIIVAANLPALEEFVFWCTNTSDHIWPTLARLRHLRNLKINGASEFTCEGILRFVLDLHDTNRGLDLSVMVRGGARSIDKMSRAFIRHVLRNRVGGNFELEYF